VVVRADFEAAEVNKAVGKTVRELSNKANIKGFRKGHVPRKTLELYFGKSGIYRETLERVAQEAFENVVSEYELDLITDPRIKPGELEEGKPFEIEFTFEVRPEVVLPDIPALSAEKTVFRVSDEDVEAAFRQVLESNAKLEPTDEDRPATEEDIVETQYTSYAVEDDGNLQELERDQKSTLALNGLRKDIADAVIGRRPAEEFTFEIKLEGDYPDARMAGTTIRYDMEVLQFMKRVVPEATDEVVSELSKERYATVEELKADLRRQMEADAEERSQATLRESAITAVAEAAEIDIPDTMIERQYAAMRRDQDNQVQRDLKQSLDDYLKHNNLSVDEFDGNLRKRAAEIVRNTLVLDAVAERDEISFTSDEINEEIMRTANAMRVNPQELADMLGKNRDQFASLAMRVRTKNTMNHIASLVQVREIDPPAVEAPEEASAEAEAPSAAEADGEKS